MLEKQIQKHESITLQAYLYGDRINSNEVIRRVTEIHLALGLNLLFCLETSHRKAMAKQRTKPYNCCASILFLFQPVTTLLVLSQDQVVQAPQSDPWYFYLTSSEPRFHITCFIASSWNSNLKVMNEKCSKTCRIYTHLVPHYVSNSLSAVVSWSTIEHLHFATHL